MGHGGLNNNWLIATDHPLAITYNYTSPLESMHASKALALLATSGSDVLSGVELLDAGAIKDVRSIVVAMILATDMANHGRDMSALKAKLGDDAAARWELASGPDGAADRRLALQVALHAADVSNPAKPWAYYNEWTDRVLDEFFAQGDLERARGLPIGMGFDKTKVTCEADKARGQLGFINFVVAPLYASVSRIGTLDLSTTAATHLAANTAKWQEVVKAAS